jgi:hypothetical protein
MASTASMLGFKANIGTGLVRPNQFRVRLQFPAFVTDGVANSIRGEFLCRATSLPASTVAPIPVFYNGRAFNVAGEREFQPWTVAIYNEDFQLRNALIRWSNGINNITNNSGILTPRDYQINLIVEQLDRNGDILKQITIVNAFPVDISAIELDWENNAQIEMFQTTFVYDWYHDNNVNPDTTNNVNVNINVGVNQ